MTRCFTLSIHRPWAEAIAAGTKTWELRENPRFGVRERLSVGDFIFVVAMDDAPEIIAAGRVLDVVRGAKEVAVRFDGSVSEGFAVAIRFEASPLQPRIPCSEVIRRHTSRVWGGRGFCDIEKLYRYELAGEPLADALRARVPANLTPAPPDSVEPARVFFHGVLLELPGVQDGPVDVYPGHAKDSLESLGA